MRFGFLAGLFAAVLLTPHVTATAFRTGDIIVATAEGDPFLGQDTYQIREIAPDGVLIQEFPNYLGLGMRFSPSGILHVAALTEIERFASDGSELPPIANPLPGDSIHSLAFDHSGNLFAGTAGGNVLAFGSDGTFRAAYPVGQASTSWIDLGPDDCTIYFLNVSHIGRFDVCTHTPLSTLPTVLGGSFGYTLLVLPDGTLLASTVPAGMSLIRQDGTVLRSYNTHAIAYALDIDPNFVWVNYQGKLAKFDLRNDGIVAGPFVNGEGIRGAAVVGATPQTIPALSPLGLMFVGLILAASGLVRLQMSGAR